MVKTKKIETLVILSGSVLILLFTGLNFFFWANTHIGIILAISYFLFFGFITGSLFFAEKVSWRLLLGTALFSSLIIIISSVTYFIYRLDTFTLLIISSTVPCILIIVQLFFGRQISWNITHWKELLEISFPKLLALVCFLFFEGLILSLIFDSQTLLAIRSPWDAGIVPKEIFILYLTATLLLTSISLHHKKSIFPLCAVIIHFLVSTTLALIIYKHGYGFDSFIHQASEKLIFEKGVINPKNFYYIGQYAFVIFVSKIFFLPLVVVDKLLVAFSFSVFVPSFVYFTSKKIYSDKTIIAFLALIVLGIPYSTFIVTTPQAFANIFTMLGILISSVFVFGDRKAAYLISTIFFIIASFFIHPLAGLPSMIFLFLILTAFILEKYFQRYVILKKTILSEVILLCSFLIPITFIINSLFSKSYALLFRSEVFKNPAAFIKNISLIIPSIQNNFRLFLDIIYTYSLNVYIFIILFSIAGFFLYRKKISLAWVYVASFLTLLMNYVLLSGFIEFSFLPEFEQSNYANRLFEVALFMLLPIFFLVFHKLAVRTKQNTLWMQSFLVIITASLLTISFYVSYPRQDSFHKDRGYNVTQADLEAVRLIDEKADKDYIVLSSQVTAAAALKEFGFKKYFLQKNDPSIEHFYYSIPTGGPLFDFYEKMVSEDSSREHVENAMDFVDVSLAYFVINKYWFRSEILIEKAKLDADRWFNIGNGEVYVFEYKKNN